MQTITQNPFAEPTTTGAASWSGLGLLLVLVYAPSAPLPWRMLIASVFAFAGTMVFLAILRRLRMGSRVLVPLVGIMLGAVVGAVSTYIAASTNLLQSLSAWRSGGFSSIVQGQYEPLWIVAAITLGCVLLADRFTAAGLGKDIATGIGVNYERVVLLGSAMVALATGVTTVVVGFVPFLGLIVPGAVSLMRGDNTRANLPWVILLGTVLLIGCDLIGRVVVAPMEIPASVILGAVGAVVFIGMVMYRRRHASL